MYGNSWRHAGGLCAQAGERTARRAFRAADAATTRAATACARQPGNSAPGAREGDRLSGKARTCPAGRAG